MKGIIEGLRSAGANLNVTHSENSFNIGGRAMKRERKHFYLMVGILIMLALIINRRNEAPSEPGEPLGDEPYASLQEYELRYGSDVVAANAAYFSMESGSDIWQTIWNFPRHLWDMVTRPSEEQMQYFLRDGLLIESPRIGGDGTDVIEMISWQREEDFVRSAQLIHVPEDVEAIPAATYINSDEPLVYIFNSHPNEMIGSTFGDLAVGEMNIVEISHVAAAIFESHGIPSLVEDRSVVDLMRANGWVFAQSYQASRIFIEERISQHPSLQFFFDFHRDGIAHDLARIDIDGRPYARVLFVIGADNPAGYEENYRMARTLHNMLEERRPGISRGISVQGGQYKNGVYNQDVASTLQLFEIGTVETTIEEAMNTMEVFSEVLAEYILTYLD